MVGGANGRAGIMRSAAGGREAEEGAK